MEFMQSGQLRLGDNPGCQVPIVHGETIVQRRLDPGGPDGSKALTRFWGVSHTSSFSGRPNSCVVGQGRVNLRCPPQALLSDPFSPFQTSRVFSKGNTRERC